jgi:hypothetical protein
MRLESTYATISTAVFSEGQMNKRPLSVTLIAFLYLIVGIVGFAFHGWEIVARHAFHYDDALIELTELIALVCGLFLLRGRNWARWLAIAWIAAHVTIMFESLQKGVVHIVILALIAYALFQADARTYFRHSEKVGS